MEIVKCSIVILITLFCFVGSFEDNNVDASSEDVKYDSDSEKDYKRIDVKATPNPTFTFCDTDHEDLIYVCGESEHPGIQVCDDGILSECIRVGSCVINIHPNIPWSHLNEEIRLIPPWPWKKEICCNNLDDDYDGKVDENLIRNCWIPLLGLSGIQRCSAGKWGACVSG